ILLLGEGIERRVADDLIELRPREQELAGSIADVARRGFLAARRQQRRLDALLIEQRRPRLELLGTLHRERERQRGARDGEHRDQPPVARGLPREVDDLLQTVARSYRCERHLSNDGTRARTALRASMEPTFYTENPVQSPRTTS